MVSAQESPAIAPGDISGLIRAVADASARLDATRQGIAVKREGVNKTLVDLQMARIELDRSIADAARTVEERERAESGVDSARSTLDDYSRILHRQGTAPGAASAILDPGGPADAGRRQEFLQRAAADQRHVVGDMVAAADEAARRESDAVRAREDAEQRYADASSRRDAAESEVAAVSAEVTALEAEVAELTRALAENQDALAESGAVPAGPATPGRFTVDGNTVDGNTVVGATTDQDALRDDAVRALASDPGAGRQAADIASVLPSHLDLGAVRHFAGGSSDAATDAVSGALGRTLGGALGGAVDAGSVGAAIDAGINRDTDAIIQQVSDAIGRADLGSVEQGPAAPAPAPGQGGGNSGTPSNSSRVETVVNRAMSQLGVPYAWGGGDAKGPTRGIRDGGVADQYGDYNKIGFDCSGLMIYAFAGIGKALPHYTGYQYTAGPQHPVATRQRGDMLFWPGHVALYLGDGKMVEAPQSGDVVKVSSVRMAGVSPMVVRLA
ncbi:NlpC/P60 family protein [Rhodococcus sp. IEGM 1408]|uniref:NlpC/P60 family protein n=1 Tax=Rhodococcus sp. IEGM 1408 TaxID=3082220 RepID=UPI0029544719|nr:NlpC/P60 family protein [Rhodococcus sp. IEGM 1408]MDV8000248.1 NlpC/P60 family protein [Rhodococcus sp. IEGM 1408]